LYKYEDKKLMKKLFKKPKYMVYMFLVLVCSFWFLHLIFAPDINAKRLGYVKNGVRVHCSGFDFTASMRQSKSGDMQGTIDVYFDDSVKIPSDILLAADYPNKKLRDVSIKYSYMLDGKLHTKTETNTVISSNFVTGGAGFRQPFPNGAKKRHLLFNQCAENLNGLFARGYIGVGYELHHCDVSEGVLYAINSRKAFRFGSVQLVEFIFQP